MSDLDGIVRKSLIAFAQDVWKASWLAKEHDCVNLFVHRYLARHLRPGSVLHDLAQIRIEGHAPQPPGIGSKNSARKDIVIWDVPEATCWDKNASKWIPAQSPMAILEWKADLRAWRGADTQSARLCTGLVSPPGAGAISSATQSSSVAISFMLPGSLGGRRSPVAPP